MTDHTNIDPLSHASSIHQMRDVHEWKHPLRLRISHKTHFHYQEFARDSYNEARLKPLDDLYQRCLAFDIEIQPHASLREFPDLFENQVHYFDLITRHQDLVVHAHSTVETYPDQRGPIPTVSLLDLQHCDDIQDLYLYLGSSNFVSIEPEIFHASLTASPDESMLDLWDTTLKIGEWIHDEFQYTPHSTNVNTKPIEVLSTRQGVCQDFAHLMIGMCRARDIPTRYVSGYFYNENRSLNEVEASHAWVEIYLPSYGWIGYDPTHRRIPDTRYVKLAIGQDYGSVMPIQGSFRGRGTREMHVEVFVDRC